MSALCALRGFASRKNQRCDVQKLWMAEILCGKHWKKWTELARCHGFSPQTLKSAGAAAGFLTLAHTGSVWLRTLISAQVQLH
jgi:hypothetical protein